MKTFRFIAPDMREAILQIRNELGPDAAIISNKKTDAGVEIIASGDYEEALIWSSLGRNKPKRASSNSNQDRAKISQQQLRNKKLNPNTIKSQAQGANKSFLQEPLEDKALIQALIDHAEISALKEKSLKPTKQKHKKTTEAGSSRLNERVAKQKTELSRRIKSLSSTFSRNETTEFEGIPSASKNKKILKGKQHDIFEPRDVGDLDVSNLEADHLEVDHFDDSKVDLTYQDDRNLNVNSLNVNGSSVNGSSMNSFDVNGFDVNGLEDSDLDASNLNTREQSVDDISISDINIHDMDIVNFENSYSDTHESSQEYFRSDQFSSLEEASEERSLQSSYDYFSESQTERDVGVLLNDPHSNRSSGGNSRASVLKQYGLSDSIVAQLVKDSRIRGKRFSNGGNDQLLALLSAYLPIEETPIFELVEKKKTRIAFLGASGAGKTTSLLKLATQYSARYGPENIAIISTDCGGIAGNHQLRRFSDLLDIEFLEASEVLEFNLAINHFSKKRLVLIDTAGRESDHELWLEQKQILEKSPVNLYKYLVLASTQQPLALKNSINDFQDLGCEACILTKLDEHPLLGEALSVLIERKLSIAYVSDGKEIPTDIAIANSKDLIVTMLNYNECGRPNGDLGHSLYFKPKESIFKQREVMVEA